MYECLQTIKQPYLKIHQLKSRIKEVRVVFIHAFTELLT